MDFKTIVAVFSVILAAAAYIPYVFAIAKGTVKPHIFTWVTWTVLTGLGFIISTSKGAGGGAWILGLQSVCSFFIALYSIFHGEENITRPDWVSFICALVISVVYIFTKQAVLSIILASIMDALGYFPTFRKSYLKPFGEPALTYALAVISNILAISAIGVYNLSTLFYPLTLLIMSGSLIIFLLIRRSQIKAV